MSGTCAISLISSVLIDGKRQCQYDSLLAKIACNGECRIRSVDFTVNSLHNIVLLINLPEIVTISAVHK